MAEATSYDGDTDRRDREEKPRACAETGIPVYLPVDPVLGEIVVRSVAEDGRYSHLDRHNTASGSSCRGPWASSSTPNP